MNKEQKFEEIITSYINGNISWVKEQVKKMKKQDRKELYFYVRDYNPNPNRKDIEMDNFFFNLI